MANYILCRKHFISLGKCEIEMADININSVSIQSDGDKMDRTSFLKYGLAYDTLQSETLSQSVNITCDIMFSQDDKGTYFKNTSCDLSYIKVHDKIIFGDTQKIYTIVTSISNGKFYVDYYTELPSVINVHYTKLQVIKYTDIKEYTKTYELKIDSTSDNAIPIFLPVMTENLSSAKSVLLHVNNNLSDTSFIFLPQKTHLNGLTKTIPIVINYKKTADTHGYTTFITNFLYNGKAWFSV